MHLKKYAYRIFALLLCCGLNRCRCVKGDYVSQEEEGFYTENNNKLERIASFKETISILNPDHDITDFRKRLADGSPKWLATRTEKKPDAIWKDFFNEIPSKIVAALKEKGHDTALLENYYDKLGKLFNKPTEETEKEAVAVAEKLQAHTKLTDAFKAYIAAKYNNPATIYLTKATLAYQEFLYFILDKKNALPIKLKKLQSNLVQWKKDGHPIGYELWKVIEDKYRKELKDSRLYKYQKNQAAIKSSLRLIDQSTNDLYSLNYKELLETLPHGTKLLNDILYEVGLEEKEDIKLLKVYLGLVSSIA